MKLINKIKQQPRLLLMMLWVIGFLAPGVCQAANSSSDQIKQPVKESIKIRQKTQQKRENWEEEKNRLILEYEKLKYEHQVLKDKNKDLQVRKTSLTKQNHALLQQHKESLKVKKELVPFLSDLVEQLDRQISNDVPFLKEERSTRLSLLKKVMVDPDITISEKYRKVMEAVFIEAEYGSTIEVYQEKIKIGGQDVLGNIFRLGRVSLFFLSLDQGSCAHFDVSSNSWQLLDEKYLLAVSSAVEIGSKRKPVELLSLPLGRLAEGGDK